MSVSASAAPTASLDGFLDLKWGESQDAARKKLSKRFAGKDSDRTYLHYRGTWAGYSDVDIYAMFYDEHGFQSVRAQIPFESMQQAWMMFDTLTQNLDSKYGSQAFCKFYEKGQEQFEINADDRRALEKAYDRMNAGHGQVTRVWTANGGKAALKLTPEPTTGEGPSVIVDYFTAYAEGGMSDADKADL